MSVTFFLASGETAYPSCPTCGGNMAHNPAPDQECEDPICEGYGPDPVDSTPSLNASLANARIIIRMLLGYEDADVNGGELDPSDVELRLSMAGYRADGAVRPTVQEGRYVDFGLSRERIDQYIATLAKLAEIANRRGESILYG